MSQEPIWTENEQSRMMFARVKEMLNEGCTHGFIATAIDSYLAALDQSKANFMNPTWRRLGGYYDEHGTRGD